MASLHKLTKTRYYVPDADAKGGRREVKAGTPGAIKETVDSRFWYVMWKEGGKLKRVNTGMTAKREATQYLSRWTEAREAGAVGLVRPCKEHLDAPAVDHLTAYLQTFKDGTRHRHEVNRVIGTFFALKKVKLLRDVSSEMIDTFVNGHPGGKTTRQRYRGYLSAFFKWLHTSHRTPSNLMDHVHRVKERATDKEKRLRRPFKVDEMRRLLKACVEYPVHCRSRHTGGRPRRDGTPAQPRKPVQLTPETLAKLTAYGEERRLMYRVQLATGLRRGELSRVTVKMFSAKKGALKLPVRILKRKPPGIAYVVIRLTPTVAADLCRHVSGKSPKEKLLHVPCAQNNLKTHKRLLAFISTPYLKNDRYADIHALRMTVNVFLRKRGVELQDRQRFMRHAAADITTAVYDLMPTITSPVFDALTRLDAIVTSPTRPISTPSPPQADQPSTL